MLISCFCFYRLEIFTFKKRLSIGLHYLLYTILVIFGSFYLLKIKFDFISPLKFIIYLKLKTYPGDFFD